MMYAFNKPSTFCCVHGCSFRVSKGTGTGEGGGSLHPFPPRDSFINGKDMFSEWANAVKLLKRFDRRIGVCPRHFTPADYVGGRLKDSAIPSLHLPRVWRNKFYPREYGKLIKLLEYRGIGRLRLCHEAKLVKRINTKERLRARARARARPVPKPLPAEPARRDNLFDEELIIKEEPLSEDEMAAGTEAGLGPEDSVEEMLARMNDEDYLTTRKSSKGVTGGLSITIEDDSACPTCGKEECRCSEFECYCGKVFRTMRQLNAHSLIHKNTGELVCMLCDKKFKHEFFLMEHVACHTLSPPTCSCPECGAVFLTLDSLDVHIKLHHKRLKKRKEFTCSECGLHFKSKTSCWQHLNSHAREGGGGGGGGGGGRSTGSTASPELACHLCGRVLWTQAALQAHVASHAAGGPPFTCPHCPRRLTTRTSYMVHVQSHVPGVRQVCPTCGLGFPTRPSLNQHLAADHPETHPFPCIICGLNFRTETRFVKHALTHNAALDDDDDDEEKNPNPIPNPNPQPIV